MSINIDTSTGVNKVTVEGELTIYEAANYHEALKEGFQADKDLEIDLAGVEETDASGIQLLAVYGKKVIENDAKVRFLNFSDDARDAVETAQLLESLGCEIQE